MHTLPSLSSSACRWVVRAFFLSLCLLAATGCGTFNNYGRAADAFYRPYRAGQLAPASSAVTAAVASHRGGPAELVYTLEEGTVLRTAGRYQDSLAAFNRAEQLVDGFDQRAAVSVRDVGSEAAAAVTNMNVLPYTGYAYDRILLNTYKALDYLQLGNAEGARVELRRAYRRQQEAVAQFQQQIAADQKAAQQKGVRYGDAKAQLGQPFPTSKGQPDLSQYAAYADFVNPFTVYLDGLVFLHTGDGNADWERARQDFQRLAGMIGQTPAIAADLQEVENRFAGRPSPALVYVIFENGMAPLREEIRLDLPIPIKDDWIYVGGALPQLSYQPADFPRLDLISDGARVGQTDPVCNMDAIIAREFKDRMPNVILRTVITTTVHAAGSYLAGREMRKRYGDAAGLLTEIGLGLASYAVTSADLRTWQTLPKEFQVARIARPASGQLRLAHPSRPAVLDVTLPPGQVVLVCVRTATPGLLTATTSTLR